MSGSWEEHVEMFVARFETTYEVPLRDDEEDEEEEEDGEEVQDG